MIAAIIDKIRRAGRGIARPSAWGDDFNLYEIRIKFTRDEATHYSAAPDHIEAVRLLPVKVEATQSIQIINHGRVCAWIQARRQEVKA